MIYKKRHVMEHGENYAYWMGQFAGMRRVTRLEQRYVNFRPAKPTPPALPQRVRELRRPVCEPATASEGGSRLLFSVRPTLLDTRLVPIPPDKSRDYSRCRGYVHPGATPPPPDAAWAFTRQQCRALVALYNSELFRQPVNAAKEHAIAA